MADSEQSAGLADVLVGLQRGDFSRLEPYFDDRPSPSGRQSRIVRWHQDGGFAGKEKELAEALTCACFLGKTKVAEYLIACGVSTADGRGTGVDALHWAANRGQLEAVRLLLRHGANPETRNRYGGTALDFTVWSAVHEPQPTHRAIAEMLIDAGARADDVDFPSGHSEIDSLLARHRSK